MTFAWPRTVPRSTSSPAAARRSSSTVPSISRLLAAAATPPRMTVSSRICIRFAPAIRSPSIVASTITCSPTTRVESPMAPRRSTILAAANTSPST